MEDEGHEIRSRVEQRWMLGISHRALALALLSVSLHLKASVSCKHSAGKYSPFQKNTNKQKKKEKKDAKATKATVCATI